jgi:hypothetical protein
MKPEPSKFDRQKMLTMRMCFMLVPEHGELLEHDEMR